MSKTAQASIWERASRGQHVAAVGRSWLESPRSLRVVRISCDVPRTTLGPLFDAQQKIEHILDASGPAGFSQAADLVMSGLRRRFLGDMPARSADAALVEACNRLARHGQPYALVFDAFDAADEVTCAYLQRIIERPGWLELPLVLALRDVDAANPATEVLDALRRVHGEEAVVALDDVRAAGPGGVAAAGQSGGESSGDTVGAGMAADSERESGPAGAARAQAGDDDSGRLDPDDGNDDDDGDDAFAVVDIDDELVLDLADLPSPVLRVLRAGAVVGSGFEAELVAELLDCTPFDVLDHLQSASDAGVPIDDRGEGRFFLPESLVEVLRDSLLPSLAASWHRRLGVILGGFVHTGGAGTSAMGAGPEYGVSMASSQPIASRAASAGDSPEHLARTVIMRSKPAPEPDALRERATAATAEPVASAPGQAYYVDVFDPSERDGGPGAAMPPDPPVAADSPAASGSDPRPMDPSADDEAPVDEAPAPPMPREIALDTNSIITGRGPAKRPVAPEGFSGPRPGQPLARGTQTGHPVVAAGGPVGAHAGAGRAAGQRRDQARAAEHLSRAGEVEAAAERYAHAAAEAAAIGAHSQAMAHGKKALEVLESLPPSPGRRRFRIQLLIAVARLQWQAASTLGDKPDPAFSLPRALETAGAARSEIHDDDPVELVAELHTLIAGICYDLGDIRSLERGLDELIEASRLLLGAGDSLGAARFLNDQAAIFVRLGDPVRAAHLLSRSRAIFEKQTSDDPVTVLELAETHHLLARLPLHARIRPGREQDAYVMGLDHARIAEGNYRDLDRSREIARVWETMGRLEMARERVDQAMERLASALQLQSQIGDITGLARSTAALSEVLVKDDKLREAIDLLGDSILLNREKGSPIGLAFNRRALTALVEAVGDAAGDGAASDEVVTALAEVQRRLDAAETTIGRIELPGEGGDPAPSLPQ